MKINIDNKYFENRTKLVAAAIEDVHINLRSIAEQENTLKQSKTVFHTELLKLHGEKRFLEMIINQIEENTNEDKIEKLKDPENPDNQAKK